MKYKTKIERNKPVENRHMMLKMMHAMLLNYRRNSAINQSIRKIAGHKLVAAQRMVTKKRMKVLSNELMPWLRMMLSKSSKAFTPSEDLLLIIEQAMSRSPEHCLCLVTLAAEYKPVK